MALMIEVWKTYDEEVIFYNSPKARTYTTDALFNIWDILDVSLIHNLIDSVPSRLCEVTKNHGHPTRY